jgi:hypothetical protein
MALQAKRLKRLRIDEASGVDSPAHLTPGWMVLKSTDAGDPLGDLTDEQIENLIKAAEAEEEEPVETTIDALATPGWLMAKAAADAGRPLTSDEMERCAALQKSLVSAVDERRRWTITPEATDRIIKEALNPVTRMEKAADAIQKAEPALSRPAALVKAADADPELAERYNEALAAPPADPVEKADDDPTWAALEKAADAIQDKAPTIDRATAVVKAADLYPELVDALARD